MQTIKKGYKQTDIGIIPEDWEAKKMGDILNLKNGYAFSSEFYSKEGVILITPGNFKINGGLSFTPKNTLRYAGTFTKEMVFQKGDLLIVMTDLTPDCNLLGKPGILDTDESVLHNQRIGKLIIKSKIIDKQFLYWFLASDIFSKRMKGTATGSTVSHTSVGSINNSFVPIPPLKEQKRIAQALSDMDGLITNLEELITKKQSLKQGAMQELLKPKEGWEVKKLGEVASLITKGTTPKRFTDTGVTYVKIESLAGDEIDSEKCLYIDEETHKTDLKRSILNEGDLLFAIAGATIGKCTIVPKEIIPANTNQALAIIRLKEEESKMFVFYSLKSKFMQKYISENIAGGAQPNLNLAQIGNYSFHTPSSKKEQKRIAKILSEIDEEIAVLENKRAKYQQFKTGMMQELLTGKIRLK
jgi:type I restriction enzyme, S subunit